MKEFFDTSLVVGQFENNRLPSGLVQAGVGELGLEQGSKIISQR